MSPLANVSLQPTAAQPLAGAAQPAQAPAAAPAALPQPLDAVAAGQIPAVPLPPVDPSQPLDPVQRFVVENANALPQVGLDLFEAKDQTTVVFNPGVLNKSTLAQADADGMLPQLLQTLSQPPAVPAAAPSTAATDVATTRAAQRPAMPVQTAPATPSLPAPKLPASTSDLLAKARVRNMGAGPQTPGIKPNPLGNAVAKRPV